MRKEWERPEHIVISTRYSSFSSTGIGKLHEINGVSYVLTAIRVRVDTEHILFDYDFIDNEAFKNES